MNKFSAILFLIAVMKLSCCLSQTIDGFQTTTNWGQKSQGVQFAIILTTNIFNIDSSSLFQSIIQNLSTNTIQIDAGKPNVQLSILLIDTAGEKHSLLPKHSVFFGVRPILKINPGDNSSETTEVGFAGVEPGEYTLKASRLFMLDGMPFIAESNPVRVHVIK